MSHPHLSDDRLIEICFDLEVTSSDRAHLQACDACASRRSNLAGTLDDIEMVMTQAADEAFPAERLARQRARILQRVDQDGRPARVIAFPAGHTHESAPRRVRPGALGNGGRCRGRVVPRRAAGRAPRARPPRHSTVARRSQRTQASVPVTQVRAAIAADDELLGQVELAASGVGPAALRPLDALTPRAWDVR